MTRAAAWCGVLRSWARADWRGRCGRGYPPVEDRDLGRAENVDVDVFPLEPDRGDLGLRHAAHGDVPDVVPDQGDPRALQHGVAWLLVTVTPHLVSSPRHR